MMKHILSLFLCVFVILLVGTVFCFADESISTSTFTAGLNSVQASGTCGDNLTWELDENGVLTISGTGAMNNYERTCPWHLWNVNTVIIQMGVTSIGDSAFDWCSLLTSITIPNSVTSIGKYAFSDCRSLTNIKIPYSVTSIGEYAFLDCTSLTSITIPNSVTSIGEYAFLNCTGLTSIRIPDSVTSIGEGAFSGCYGLEQINVDSENTEFSSIDGIMYNKSQTQVVLCPASKKGIIDLPDSLTSIGKCAFNWCTNLTNMTIPGSVKTLESGAFSNCSGLTSLTIPDSVTSIGSAAFSGCSSLTSITIPKRVTSISLTTFSGCSGLTSITIPAGVTSIGHRAFYGCSGLTSITIPDGVTSIGEQAFANCSGLTNIAIPTSVDSIGAGAFSGCTNVVLKVETGSYAEHYAKENGLNTTNANYGDNLTWELDENGVLTISGTGAIADNCFANRSDIKSVIISEGVTGIGIHAFYACGSLTSITIPSSVISIKSGAFYSCSGLTNISIPTGVEKIGNIAFGNCSGLTSITIPSSTTIIAGSAFVDCSNLEQIIVDSKNVEYCAENGILYNKTQTLLKSCPGGKKGSISIPSSVETIGYCSFQGCARLTSISIPKSVTSIEYEAFNNCTNAVLKVDAGSYAEQYAKDNKLKYEMISHTFSKSKSVIPSNSYFYRGASIVPEYAQKIKIYCYETDELLVQGRDYEVEYSDPVNAGMCHITVRGINGYDGIDGKPSESLPDGDGSLKGSFVILARSLTDRATAALDSEEYWYTGKEICPEVTVTCYMDDTHVVYSGETDWPYVGYQTLKKDKDYTVSYSNNTEPGSAKIIITGIGNFSSTVTETFEILPAIKIPSFVTEIGSQAFENTAAEVIIIPETCRSVAADAFDGCTKLKYIVNYSALTIVAPEGVTVKDELKSSGN